MTQKKFNIGVFHYIANFTDGVSLEMNKWRKVFEAMGHTVHYCAGDYGAASETIVPEMYHHIPAIEILNDNTFKELKDFTAEEYRDELFRWADILAAKFRQFIIEKEIDFIVPQNVFCVAANPAVAIALERVRKEFDLPAAMGVLVIMGLAVGHVFGLDSYDPVFRLYGGMFAEEAKGVGRRGYDERCGEDQGR